jgi:hypothetical protein
MREKLIAACIAAVAACVIAPAASASPVLTESGSAVATGSLVKATNTSTMKLTAGELTTECTHVELWGGEVRRNTGSKIEAEFPWAATSFSGTGTLADCTSNLGSVKVTEGNDLCLETVSGTDNARLSGCGITIKFTVAFTGVVSCVYRTTSITGTFSTNADAAVTFSEQPFSKSEGGFLCPSSGKLDMSLSLTTASGSTLLVS